MKRSYVGGLKLISWSLCGCQHGLLEGRERWCMCANMLARLHISIPEGRSVDVRLGWTLPPCHVTADTLANEHASVVLSYNEQKGPFSSLVFLLVQLFRRLDLILFFSKGLYSSGFGKNIWMSSTLGHRWGLWRPHSGLSFDKRGKGRIPSIVLAEPLCSLNFVSF